MEVMDLNEVCKSLKITVQTARNRICLGLPMPPSFKIGRRRLFLATEVEKWIGIQASRHTEYAKSENGSSKLQSNEPGKWTLS